MAESPENLALMITLEGVSQVIAAVNTITQAFTQQNRHITKNMLAYMALLDDMIGKLGKLAETELLISKIQDKGSEQTKESQKKVVEVLGEVTTAFQNVGNVSAETWAGIGADIVGVIKGGGGGLGLNAIAPILSGIGNQLSSLAGRFQVLNSMGGLLGGVIGFAAGGPGGGLIGAGAGQLLGGLGGVILDIPNKLFGLMSSVVKIIWDGISSILRGIAGIGGAIKNLIFGPLSLFGLGAFASFRSLSQGIQQTIDDVYDAAQAFQQLRISIETLTTREVAREMGISDFTKITEEATAMAERLFSWLTKISLTSPFTMQSIARSMKFASAMGLSIGMTEKLTIATGNFAAAMGISEDHQERIMYNLAQIYQQGKLTGREFRDLAISFVPVYDILGEMAAEAGTTTEAFKKLALEGGVPVEDFFVHFVNYMDRNYKNAMEKMSRTMVGVKNNIKDFIQVVLGMELLGPLLDEISGKLADVLTILLSPKTHFYAQQFGQGLVFGFKQVAESINGLLSMFKALFQTLGFGIPTINSLARAWTIFYLNIKYAINFFIEVIAKLREGIIKKILPVLGEGQKDSGKWGFNLIANFALGMAKAAGTILARVIIYIGAILRVFKGSSPPPIAADIDKWGAGLINSWVRGMLDKADWGAVKEIGKKFTSTLAASVSGTEQPIGPGTPPHPGGNIPTPEPGEEITQPWKQPAKMVKDAVEAVASAVSQFVPFITEQGMKLAAALMKGFGKVDYGILDELQGVFKDAQEAMVGLGLMAEESSYANFYDFSQDLIAAISEFNKTGEISTHILEQMSSFSMGLGPELANLVRLEFDYAKAMQALATSEEAVAAAKKIVEDEQWQLDEAMRATEQAQRDLDAAIAKTGEARGTVRSLVYEYNALLRGGANKAALKNKLKELNAAEGVVRQRMKEETAAEKVVKAAEEKEEAQRVIVDLAQRELDLAERNRDVFKEQAEALKDAVDSQSTLIANMIELLQLQAQARSAAAAAAEEGMGLGFGFPEEEFEMPEFEPIDWEQLAKDLAPEIDKFWHEIAETFKNSFDAEMGSINTQEAANKFAETLHKGLLGAFNLIFGIGKGDGLWLRIKTWLLDNWGLVAGIAATYIIFGPGWGTIMTAFVIGARLAIAANPDIADLLAAIFHLDIIGIGKAIAKLTGYTPWKITGGFFKTMFTNIFENFRSDFIGSLSILGNIGKFFVALISGNPFGAFALIKDLIGNVITGVVVGDSLSNETTTQLENAGTNISNTVLNSAGGGVDAWFADHQYMNSIISQMAPKKTDIVAIDTTGKSITNTLLDASYQRIIPWFNSNNVSTKINNNLSSQVTLQGLNYKLIGHNITGYVGSGMSEYVSTWLGNNNIAGKFATSMDAQIDDSSETLKSLGVDIVHSIGPGIIGESDWLAEQINILVEDAVNKYTKTYSKSPIQVFFDLGTLIADSIASGVLDGSKAIKDSLNKSFMEAYAGDTVSNLAKSALAVKLTSPAAERVSAPAVNKVINMNFGDVHVGSEMEWAIFKSRVNRALTEG